MIFYYEDKFRQLGQYEDKELDGLYYNRFRYYSPEEGLYISQDPIGLAGNNPNFYAYVHDSNTMVDPFGLDWHKVIIQAQGDGLEKSVSWNRATPPTSKEGLSMLDELTESLTKGERKARQEAIDKAKKVDY